jgi:hypothetical protein
MSCNACFAIGQPLGDSPLICVNVCVLLYAQKGGRQKLLASERSTPIEYQYDCSLCECVCECEF